ncbi:MAG TPA: signal peptidase I, partial [Candidatus Latescibacteria bacterium]|nr:signal peptidase I [Candidatus Latescibacterota bacterium]
MMETRSIMRVRKRTRKSPLREYVEWILTVIIVVFFVRQFVVQAFRIPSGSMEDTLLVGDFLLANKFIYGARSPDHIPLTGIKLPYFRLPAIRKPRPGDVIIFKYPRNPSRDFIKRVIAVEGQVVEMRDKVVYVDGKRVPDPPKSKHTDPQVFPGTFGHRDN